MQRCHVHSSDELPDPCSDWDSGGALAAASCTAHARQIRTVKVSRDSTQQHMTQGYSLQSVEWFHKCTGPASWATLTFLILNQGCLLSLPLLPRQNSSQQSQRFPSSWSSTHTHTHIAHHGMATPIDTHPRPRKRRRMGHHVMPSCRLVTTWPPPTL